MLVAVAGAVGRARVDGTELVGFLALSVAALLAGRLLAGAWSAIVVSLHSHTARTLGTYHRKKSAFLSMTAALLVGALYGCGTAQQK